MLLCPLQSTEVIENRFGKCPGLHEVIKNRFGKCPRLHLLHGKKQGDFEIFVAHSEVEVWVLKRT